MLLKSTVLLVSSLFLPSSFLFASHEEDSPPVARPMVREVVDVLICNRTVLEAKSNHVSILQESLSNLESLVSSIADHSYMKSGVLSDILERCRANLIRITPPSALHLVEMSPEDKIEALWTPKKDIFLRRTEYFDLKIARDIVEAFLYPQIYCQTSGLEIGAALCVAGAAGFDFSACYTSAGRKWKEARVRAGISSGFGARIAMTVGNSERRQWTTADQCFATSKVRVHPDGFFLQETTDFAPRKWSEDRIQSSNNSLVGAFHQGVSGVGLSVIYFENMKQHEAAIRAFHDTDEEFLYDFFMTHVGENIHLNEWEYGIRLAQIQFHDQVSIRFKVGISQEVHPGVWQHAGRLTKRSEWLDATLNKPYSLNLANAQGLIFPRVRIDKDGNNEMALELVDEDGQRFDLPFSINVFHADYSPQGIAKENFLLSSEILGDVEVTFELVRLEKSGD